MISIIIDTREPTTKIRPIIDKLLNGDRFRDIKVEYKKLDYGDYLIKNGKHDLVIQRKAIGDYVSSYGGLPEQFLNLRLLAQRQALVIEGHYVTKLGSGSIWLDRGNGYEEVMKIQTSTRMFTRLQDNGIWVYWTNDLFETILTMFYIAEYLPELEHKSCSGKLPISDVLMAIPGIGEGTLSGIKTKYKSPFEALKNIELWAKKKVKDGLSEW